MKKSFFILFILISYAAFSNTPNQPFLNQDSTTKKTWFIGNFSTINGKLEIKKDSSFILRYGVCFMQFWQQGKWIVKTDTIIFQPILVFDTTNINGLDTIFLSEDNIPNRFTSDKSSLDLINTLDVSQINKSEAFKVIRIKNKLYYLKKDGKVIKKVKGRERRIKLKKMRIDGTGGIYIKYRKKYSAEFYPIVN